VLTPAQIGYRAGLEADKVLGQEILGQEMQPHAGREVPGRKEENRWALRSIWYLSSTASAIVTPTRKVK
jgi:hypothetical protein